MNMVGGEEGGAKEEGGSVGLEGLDCHEAESCIRFARDDRDLASISGSENDFFELCPTVEFRRQRSRLNITLTL